MNTDFKIIPKKEVLKGQGLTIPEWRHNFVYNLVGSLYTCGGGLMRIEFEDGFNKTIKCKNFAKTLDSIIYQLMAPKSVKRTNKWIPELLKDRNPFTIEEIERIKVTIENKIK